MPVYWIDRALVRFKSRRWSHVRISYLRYRSNVADWSSRDVKCVRDLPLRTKGRIWGSDFFQILDTLFGLRLEVTWKKPTAAGRYFDGSGPEAARWVAARAAGRFWSLAQAKSPTRRPRPGSAESRFLPRQAVTIP